MCLIALAYRQHPEYPLILVANRDERYDRPTEPAHFWPDHPGLLAGRDLEQGGTWLGIGHDGRWAAVTNFRDLEKRRYPRSRGELPHHFLARDLSAADYLRELEPVSSHYGGFNLLLGDAQGLWYCSNRSGGKTALTPGLYGLSNHLLDTPWPKLVRAKANLRRLLAGTDHPDPEQLGLLLADPTTYEPDPQHLPPATADPQLERGLSAAFITTAQFGTRCTTVLMISRRREALFVEKSFGPGGQPGKRVEWRFRLEA